MQRFSQRSEGSEPHLGLPSQGVLRWEDEPQNFLETQRAGEYRDFTLKTHRISQGPGQKPEFERSLGQTHLLNLESLPDRQEATGTCPGDTDTGGSHLGSSFYHMDSAAGKLHCGIL